MANNSKKRSNNGSHLSILNRVAFITVMLLALAFLISFILGWIDGTRKIASIITRIATAFTLIITIMMSYPAAVRQKRHWFILWVIAAIIVFAAYVLGVSFNIF